MMDTEGGGGIWKLARPKNFVFVYVRAFVKRCEDSAALGSQIFKARGEECLDAELVPRWL